MPYGHAMRKRVNCFGSVSINYEYKFGYITAIEVMHINPFPPNVYIYHRIVKILILKKEGIMEKIPMSVMPMSL